MQDLTFYIEDDRYKVATLRIVSAADESSVRRLAAECLEESPHHLAVEVWEANLQLLKLTNDPSATPQDRTLAC